MPATLAYEPGSVLDVLALEPSLMGKLNNPEVDCRPEFARLIVAAQQLEVSRPTLYLSAGDYTVHLTAQNPDFRFPEWLTIFFEPGARLFPRAVRIEEVTGQLVELTRDQVTLDCADCCQVEASADRSDVDNNPARYGVLPAVFRVIIEGQIVAGLEQIFVTDAFRSFCRQVIRMPVDNNNPIIARQGGQCTNPTIRTSNTKRLVAVSAIVGPLGEQTLYPHWWGSARALHEVALDELLKGEGAKRIWEIYNTTTDNKALDACLLASRPGQTLRFVGQHELVKSNIRPGRLLEGYTATITRPTRQSIEPPGPATTEGEVINTLNVLKASYQRHLRSKVRGTGPETGSDIHVDLSDNNVLINDIDERVPLARNVAQAVALARELIERFVDHRNNAFHHRNAPLPDAAFAVDALRLLGLLNSRLEQEQLRGLVQSAPALMGAFNRHFLDDQSHFNPDIDNLPGFTPQQEDRTFTTEDLVRDTPACNPTGREPVAFRGFTFQVDPASQGPFAAFELEQASWIFLGASVVSQGVVTATVEDCSFLGSTSDGIAVNRHAVAVIRRCRAKDCFRAGFTITGGNSKVDLSEFLTQGSAELRSGIDVEVDPFRGGRRFLIESDAPGPVDSTYDLTLRNVYLSRNLQLAMAGVDTLSRPSSVVAEGLVCDDAPYVLMGTHTEMTFKGCKLTSHELFGEASSSSIASSNLGTLTFLYSSPDVATRPIVFDSCILATRASGFVRGQNIPPSQIERDPDSVIHHQLHEYAALAINPSTAVELDVTVRHCVLHAEDIEAMATKARGDLNADVAYNRFLLFDDRVVPNQTLREKRLSSMFVAAGFAPPGYMLAGIFFTRPGKLITPTRTNHRIRVEGCAMGPGFLAGVVSAGPLAVELRRNRIEASVGFIWGGDSSTTQLDVLIEQGQTQADRFMLVDLTNLGGRRLEFSGVGLVAGDACWSWWTGSMASQGNIVFVGHRVLTAPKERSPCQIERDIDLTTPIDVSRRTGVHLGLPGDRLKITDPAPGSPLVWVNAQSGQPWFPAIDPDWRLLWKVQ